MTTEHTNGRLKFRENGDANSYALLDDQGGWLLAPLHNGQEVTATQIANMRRLAACWNACEGISTENLEANAPVKELAERYNEALKKITRLESELEAVGAGGVQRMQAQQAALEPACIQPTAILPAFLGAPKRKLNDLLARGYRINGFSIEKPVDGAPPKRGFINVDGLVGWWLGESQQAAQERQPLTDEQLRHTLRSCPHDTVENLRVRWLYAKDFARAIEAAHGIKGSSA